MVDIGVLILLIACFGGAMFIYKSMTKSKDLSFYEAEVAASFAARAHRLISEGVRIDQMPYSYDKHREHNEWVSDLHLYLDDYEIEVAERIPKNSSIKAYGGIRLIQDSSTIALSKRRID